MTRSKGARARDGDARWRAQKSHERVRASERDAHRATRREGASDVGLGRSGADARAGTSRLLDAALGERSDEATVIDVPMRGGVVPKWVERCDEAGRDVARIRENLLALREAHAKALLPNFEDVGGKRSWPRR